MSLDDSMRCLRRTWDQSKYRLLKYNSLPELQERPLSHCRHCGVTNSLISATCLSCTSMPRARRASAPSSVFIQIDLSPSSGRFILLSDNHPNIDSNRSPALSKQSKMDAKPSPIDPPPTVPSITSHIPVQTLVVATAGYDRCTASHPDYTHDTDTHVVHDYTRQRNSLPVRSRESFGDVATTTCSPPTSYPLFSQTHTVPVEQMECNPEENNSGRTECLTRTENSGRTLTSSAPFTSGSVDRSHSDPTTTVRPNIALKISRGAFNVGCADGMPTFHPDDTAKNVSLINDEMTPPPIKSAHSPKHQHFRPLRRKNHLQILPTNPDSDASEPIAISLTLHHSPPPTSPHLGKKASQILTDYISPHPKTHSHPQSIAPSISSGTTGPVTPPMTPTHQRSLPSSAPPKTNSAGTTGSSSPESSPVRLGHPSRPYYNAIRKNGISPPPSRARPLSQPPPSSFHLGFGLTPAETAPESTTMTTASRHVSMSAIPPAFSAFSLTNDGDDNDDDDDNNDDFEVHSGPTNSARLSLSSSLHRLSFTNHTQNRAQHAQSLSRANGMNSNRSSGIGFSMSGETELRMALATSPSGVATLGRTTEDGFRFRETAIPSQNVANDNTVAMKTEADYLHAQCSGSRDSFLGRVKKLRKGLKEILTNKNTMTARTATR